MNPITTNKMKTLIFASHNENKAKEIRALLPVGLELKTLNDIGLKEEIPETGMNLEENAKLKARFIFENYHDICFADDTGLEVECLNKEPGVFSARYAGPQKSSEDNMAKLLVNMVDQTNRKAQFRTVFAFIDKDGNENLFEGIVEGEISLEKMGEKGFGYDPIFIPQGHSLSFAQMSAEEKNKISHRARALRKFLDFLNSQSHFD